MGVIRYLCLLSLCGLGMLPIPASRAGPVLHRKPRLHVVSIGVDDCGFSEHLRFACADAEAFAGTLREIASSVYAEVLVDVLRDPTKADVLAMVRQQLGRQRTGDTLAFFFSGTEVVDDNGEFRLLLRSPLAPDALKALGEAERHQASVEASLPVQELYSLLERMPAQNHFIVLDTCHSDLALDAIGRLESASTALERGDRERRLVCLAVEGLSFESSELGHGVLTATLLEGARGSADRLPGVAGADGLLTAREMEAWCLARYPRLVREVDGRISAWGRSDAHPCSYSRGGDFILGRVSLPDSSEPGAGPGGTTRGEDKEGPRIELLSPPPVRGPIRTEAQDLELQLQVEDPSGVYKVTVDGRACQARRSKEDEGVVWTVRVPLAVGEQTVLAEAWDRAYQRSEKTWTIVRTTEGLAARPERREGRDYALIVGIEDYDHWTTLDNPIRDARAVAKELNEAYGFETEILENPDRKGLLEKLREYTQKRFDPGDQLLVFIAGHGHLDKATGTAYVIPKDAAARDELGETYVSHMKVVNWLDRVPCEHVLVVLDVCFGGAFFETRATRSESAALYADVGNLEFIRKKLSRPTRKWMTSGGSEYVPDGNRRVGHSPFAFRLLEALRTAAEGDEARILTFAGLFACAERARPVPRAGGFGRDAPGSDFLFIPARGAPR